MGEREVGVRYLFKMCSEKYMNDDIQSMKFNCNDRGNEHEFEKEYSMCYNKNNPNLKKFCGPDWIFHSWPCVNIYSFEDTKNQIMIESTKPPTIDKAAWFGNIYSPLRDVIEYRTRPLLKQIGDKHPELLDIVNISPNNGLVNTTISNYVSLPELTKYKYLIDIGGNGFSGRLKFLLFSKRPILLIDRHYVDYFYEDLIPYTHYIPVKMDLSDLLDQIDWMKTNHEKTLRIAQNAFDFAIHTFTTDKILEKIYWVYTNIHR